MVAVDRRRALAADDRPHLLQRHRRLPGGPRPGPRAGVDRGARPLVRCAAADGRLHRHLPGAPRRDPAARRRLGAGARGGRPGLRALPGGIDPQPPAAAFYRRPRCIGCAATSAPPRPTIGSASRHGCEPQPGLALLRLAQGRAGRGDGRDPPRGAHRHRPGPRAAAAGAGRDHARRGRAGAAEEPAASWRQTRGDARAPACRKRSRRRRGARVLLADGDAAAALSPLRPALDVWQATAAPYEAARARVLIGLACRALDDAGGRRARARRRAGRLRRAWRRARPRPGRRHRRRRRRRPARPHPARARRCCGWSPPGKTNKAVAAELFLSERTIERHLSNIFTKLDLPTRAAATAWAYEHGLV